jgi:hypothetical protein
VKKLHFLEVHSVPYSQKKFQKITAILDASSKVTESGQNRFGEHGPLGVKEAMVLINIIHKESCSFFTCDHLITWHKMGHLS